MGAQQAIINVTKMGVGGLAFVGTFFTLIELMYFFSHPGFNGKRIAPAKDMWVAVSWGLLVNMSLLSLFVLQHSLLALPALKEAIKNRGLPNAYRSIYVLLSAVSLQILTRCWYDIAEVSLWQINLNFRPLWWMYWTIHVSCWLFIYVGNICMDMNELMGIKQIYYSIVNLPDPNRRKSRQLQRLNSHVRHPSFIAFTLLLWSVPVMSLDRLLLATILTVYMFIAWNPDQMDYVYQRSQYVRKFHELERLEAH